METKHILTIVGILVVASFFIVTIMNKEDTTITGEVIADFEEENINDTEEIIEEEKPAEIVRWPETYEQMQVFITPDEVEYYLPKITKYFKQEDDIEDNIDTLIDMFWIRYRDDSMLFNQVEYWQTPAETLEKGHGDCEDWAVTSLSLIRAYDSSVECYNALWPTHVSVYCKINDKHIIYDQDETKRATTIKDNPNNDYAINQENEIRFRKLLNNYFKYYGIPANKRKLGALFNENELITFEDNEEFIDWALEQ